MKLQKTLRKFVHTHTVDQATRMINRHPELLSTEAEDLLQQMITKAKRSAERQDLEVHRGWLHRYQEAAKEHRQQWLQSLNAFVNAETWEASKAVLIAHPELMSEEIDAFLQQIITTQETEEAARFWAGQRAVLAHCREVGVEQAFADRVELSETATPALEIPAELAPLIDEIVQLTSPEEMPQRVQICQQALEQVDRQQQPELWAALQVELGNSFYNNPFDDRDKNLEWAIQAYEKALQVRTHQDFPVDWAATQNNLGLAYHDRVRENRAENMERAIQAYESALQVYTHQDFPIQWAMTQNNLGTAYTDRIREDRAENLERAIQALESALQVYTYQDFPVDWASTQNNLGAAYRDRIREDRAENLERAIQALEFALQVYTRQDFPIQWAMTQNNLGGVYYDRIREDRAENLERAIQALESALQVRTHQDFPVDWAATQNNLGLTYHDRIRGDRAVNLERAIQALESALQVYTRQDFPIQWAMTQNNLGTAYRDRIRENRAENLERAIQAFESALQVRTRQDFPIQWAMTQNNLGLTYHDRIRGDRAVNLERAIQALESALQVYTRQDFPIQWAMTQNNLGKAYRDRIREDRAANLERAIQALESALQVYTRQDFPIQWAMTQNNLGIAYHGCIWGDRAANLERAIQAFENALQVYTQQDSPDDWAMTQCNLGIAYRDRIRGDRAENLERAIRAFENGLQVYTCQDFPVDWATTQINLGIAYRDRIRKDRAENLEQAIRAFENALTIFYDANENVPRLPVECRGTAQSLGNLLSGNAHYLEAIQPYQIALEAAEILYQSSIFHASQEAELTEAFDLYRQAAYAYAHSNDLPRAVVTMEQGRARGLSETLERDRADLAKVEQIAPAAYQRYQEAAAQLRLLETLERRESTTSALGEVRLSQEELRQMADQAHAEFEAALQQVRQLPGYADFLAPPTWEDITQAVRPGLPVVYLVTTPVGSLALIGHQLTQAEGVFVEAIWLDHFTEEQLRELLQGHTDDPELGGWFGAYGQHREDPKNVQKHQTWLDTIDQVTFQLWPALIEPIAQKLEFLGAQQAILIPTSYLAFLPLHAAWTEDATCPTGRRYALDSITFTYAPNAQSLTYARQVAQHTAPTSLLAIDEPRPVHAGNLPSSRREVETALATFPYHQVLRHQQATRSAVLAALPQHSMLHFCCHGYANFNEPLESGLLMADDEILTLRDLLNLPQNDTRLAVLSACETGIPGTKLPDEVVSLPTGLLQAGVAGVAASLWSVDDISTMILLTHFYDLWRKGGLEPAEALRQAQQWVRDTTSQQKAKYFEETNPDIFQSLILLDPDYFAHPFHWAAFTYMGV